MPAPHNSIFYGPDALPTAQNTLSMTTVTTRLSMNQQYHYYLRFNGHFEGEPGLVSTWLSFPKRTFYERCPSCQQANNVKAKHWAKCQNEQKWNVWKGFLFSVPQWDGQSPKVHPMDRHKDCSLHICCMDGNCSPNKATRDCRLPPQAVSCHCIRP